MPIGNSPRDFPAQVQAIMAGVADLRDSIKGEPNCFWEQLKNAYAIRKYEGEAVALLVMQPCPLWYVQAEADDEGNLPKEAHPSVVYDCQGRAWTICVDDAEAETVLEVIPPATDEQIEDVHCNPDDYALVICPTDEHVEECPEDERPASFKLPLMHFPEKCDWDIDIRDLAPEGKRCEKPQDSDGATFSAGIKSFSDMLRSEGRHGKINVPGPKSLCGKPLQEGNYWPFEGRMDIYPSLMHRITMVGCGRTSHLRQVLTEGEGGGQLALFTPGNFSAAGQFAASIIDPNTGLPRDRLGRNLTSGPFYGLQDIPCATQKVYFQNAADAALFRECMPVRIFTSDIFKPADGFGSSYARKFQLDWIVSKTGTEITLLKGIAEDMENPVIASGLPEDNQDKPDWSGLDDDGNIMPDAPESSFARVWSGFEMYNLSISTAAKQDSVTRLGSLFCGRFHNVDVLETESAWTLNAMCHVEITNSTVWARSKAANMAQHSHDTRISGLTAVLGGGEPQMNDRNGFGLQSEEGAARIHFDSPKIVVAASGSPVTTGIRLSKYVRDILVTDIQMTAMNDAFQIPISFGFSGEDGEPPEEDGFAPKNNWIIGGTFKTKNQSALISVRGKPSLIGESMSSGVQSVKFDDSAADLATNDGAEVAVRVEDASGFEVSDIRTVQAYRYIDRTDPALGGVPLLVKDSVCENTQPDPVAGSLRAVVHHGLRGGAGLPLLPESP